MMFRAPPLRAAGGGWQGTPPPREVGSRSEGPADKVALVPRDRDLRGREKKSARRPIMTRAEK
jgi:hypothetical protein